MGLFWRQATNKAALWTALITIPLGILFKTMLPEMPWMMRMGYVFIILCFVATAITFADKKVWTSDVKHIVRAGYIRSGYILIAIGAVAFIAGIVLHSSLADLGIQSAYMFAAALAFVGMILVANEKIIAADKNAIELDPKSFATDASFNIGAVAIVVILFLLYYVFW